MPRKPRTGKSDRPANRPTKFTPGRIAVILVTLRGGATRTAAAAAAGIDPKTLYEWDRDSTMVLPEDISVPAFREDDPDVVYEAGTAFGPALTRAEGEAEAWLVSRVRKAGTDAAKVTFYYDRQGNLLREQREYDWRAAAWLLDHSPKHRANWLPKQGVEVSGPDGGPIATDGKATVVFSPDPAYLAALGRMAAVHDDDDDDPTDAGGEAGG